MWCVIYLLVDVVDAIADMYQVLLLYTYVLPNEVDTVKVVVIGITDASFADIEGGDVAKCCRLMPWWYRQILSRIL